MFRRSLLVARSEYTGFLLSRKIFIMLFSFIFLAEDVIGKMGTLAAETGMTIGKTEPFILILSYEAHAMIIPVVFAVMLSDFPSGTRSGYFAMVRTSRVSWLLGEVLYAVMTGLTFLIVLFAGSVLWIGKQGAYLKDWSPYITELSTLYPEKYELNNQLFIRAGTVAQGSPLTVMLHGILLMLLYLVVLSLLLAFFKLLSLKKAGIFISIALTVTGAASISYAKGEKWLFPVVHSIFETHFQDYHAVPEFPLWGSYLYFACMILALFLADRQLVKKVRIGEEDGY